MSPGKQARVEAPAPPARRLRTGIAVAAVAIGAGGFLWWRAAQARSAASTAVDIPDPKTAGFEAPVQEAIAQARLDVVDHPSSSKAWASFARVLDAHRMIAQAEIAYRRALALGGEDPELSYNLAILLDSRGELVESLERFRKFAQLSPNFPPVHFRIGRGLAVQGDMPGAAQAYRKALELDPNLKIARRALGQVLISLDDPQGAKTELERVAATPPVDGPTQAALVQIYRRLGDTERADAAMQKSRDAKDVLALPDPVQFVVTKAGRTAKMASSRAAIRFADGDYAGAVEDLKIVLRTHGQDPTVHERLAEAYRRLGQPELAAQEVAESQRLRGEH
jgi:Flp pilus assembly protein TadD